MKFVIVCWFAIAVLILGAVDYAIKGNWFIAIIFVGIAIGIGQTSGEAFHRAVNKKGQ